MIRSHQPPAPAASEAANQLAELDAVYRQHSRPLWAIFYAQTGDGELAMDAVQESFLRLQRFGVNRVRMARVWLSRVGRNWLIDQSRRKRPVPTADLSHIAATVSLPEDETATKVKAVRDALQQLSESDRQVLALKYTCGWSSVQIGGHLGIKTDAVDMRLSRARRRLAAILDKETALVVQR